MRFLKTIILAAACTFSTNVLLSQNTTSAFDEFNKNMAKMWDDQEKVTGQMWKEYYEFRDKCNREYAKFLLESWDTVTVTAPAVIAQPNQIKPQIYNGTAPEHTVSLMLPAEVEETAFVGMFKEAKPFKFLSEMVATKLKGKLKETFNNTFKDPFLEKLKIGKDKEEPAQEFDFQFYGTNISVTMAANMPHLKECSALSISRMWTALSKESHNDMIVDCLTIKQERDMCDWAYLQMLQALGSAYYSNSPNDATLLAAYIFVQSGYKIKLATHQERLLFLYASDFVVVGSPYYTEKGFNYFIAQNSVGDMTLDFLPDRICMSKAQMENETPLSMYINKNMKLDMNLSETKELHSKLYPELKSNINLNSNLIDFYGNYPRTMLSGISSSTWITYANTPLSDEVKQTLYPAITKMVEGKDTSAALTVINNLIHSSFGIKSDDELWGRDRIFFAEETLNYHYADCEDRSILFARIVRDILGYEVVLIHYPGHLACGVKVNEKIYGSYRSGYLVCDPSYINTPIGTEMPEVRNLPAKIIKLNNTANQ